ncbi:MAG: beta-ketoacyl synthase chain length factor [Halieaceae bacterium]|nr:beta-ketoacyl synthase chain length factor [Halieaceae bacterium]
MKVVVERWSSWESRAGQAALCCHYSGPGLVCEEVEQPDLGTVPALKRRRLGALARTVFHVLDRCADTDQSEPVVFSSYLGEIKRTQALLESVAAGGPVSPMAFSLSVHNAIAGQWSLIRGIKAPMTALSPPAGSPVPALLEAQGILLEGHYPAVNVAYFEEDYPGFYAPFFSGAQGPCALALRLVPETGGISSRCLRLELEQLSPALSPPVSTVNISALGGLLAGQRDELVVSEPQCRWRLRRRS